MHTDLACTILFFNPKIRVLREETRVSRVRLHAERTTTNLHECINGGMSLQVAIGVALRMVESDL